ncbi:PLP-dependent aminotransferase family protein [Roseomonas sp. E05]|uniref:MocR-like pyridoxine biosynthesis transcription factor PdxR n=1 Tax=Roseomonas sp. E05 TaxID=3046310 RepID=UPI0024BAD530|nr:PLP-dependent aminotransferase family protein [Roseomonas sp. E05]MDJ0390255.1 PLP-dependent aminotransferase family protein [Roseomonas sp. E05]
MKPEAPAPERVTQRLCEAIKTQITSGLLGPSARLPSTRSLAAEWGVSRTTATAAYEQLIAEGYLVTRQGARTQVAKGLGQFSACPGQPTMPTGPDRLSAFGQRLASFPLPSVVGPARLVVDFRYGDLAADDFPMLAWRKAVTGAVLRRKPRLRYEDPGGSPSLRAALQGYLWRARGVRCDPKQIIVVNGSQQGLDLCARLLLNPGDRALMENPGYNLARQVFLAAGAEVVPVAVDQEGMRTQGLPPARLAYATPSHQFPLGGVMSVGRRRELLAWARHEGAHVIEDDYDSEYRYDIAPIPTVQAMDDAGRVIYLGTVSKTLSPTLRLGYLVVPVALSNAFAQAKRLADRHAPSLEQEALADLIESGAYERHVRRVRRQNGKRRSALLAALSAKLGDAVTVVGADAGLHVVAWLNDIPRAAEEEFVSQAASAGLGIYPISPLCDRAGSVPYRDCAGLILGYGALDAASIERGIELLTAVIRSRQQG